MGVYDRAYRFAVVTQSQHPFKHTLSDFAYSNPALPGVTNINAAFNYLVAAIYPNAKAAVATPADLPTGVDTPNPGDVTPDINDYRVVQDDGDGNFAAYRYEQREGEVSPSWHKVLDADWSTDSILAQLLDVTQPLYLYKAGLTDIDGNGDPITGLYAGQRVYGGDQANQNLTLNANSGDGVGPQTGFVQSDGNFRPTVDATYNLSTATERWLNGYFSNSVVVGTTTYGSAIVQDSTGQISFDDENLITTGNINGAVITGTQLVADDGSDTMVLAPGSITDSTGTISLGAADLSTTGTLRGGAAILTESGQTLTFNAFESTPDRSVITSSTGLLSFGDENLVTTGTLSVGELTTTALNVDNLRLDGNTVSSTDANGNITLSPNGTGQVELLKSLSGLNASFVGTVGVTGVFNADNLTLDANTISSTNLNGNISLVPNGTGEITVSSNILPSSDASLNLGGASNRFQDLYLSGGLNDGTSEIEMATLMGLRSALFRDTAQTQPAQTGDALFYDAVSGQYLASIPNSEITHSTLSGLTTGDAGHTQFALLAGRAGGQTLIGGTAASENLTLESTADATKGLIRFSDDLVPTTSASFSGTWSGTNLGGPSNLINDVYTRGEFLGFRLENVLSTSLPSFSGQTPGRLYYATDNNKAYVDTGAALKVLGVAKYAADQVFDGIITQLNVDVSSEIGDARFAQWQLLDNGNNFEIMGVTIQITSASNVRIITNFPLPVGSYRLIGVE